MDVLGTVWKALCWLVSFLFHLPDVAMKYCFNHVQGDLGFFLGVGAFVLIIALEVTVLTLPLLFFNHIPEGAGYAEEENETFTFDDDLDYQKKNDIIAAYAGETDDYVLAHDLLDDN